MSDDSTISVVAVGDVCVDREDPDSIFSAATSVIRSSDIAFCQLETVYSEKGSPVPQCRFPLRAHPRSAPAIKRAGFNVVSFAGNRSMDWGAEAMLDTIAIMKKTGIDVFGAGKDIDEARKAKIVECKGTKIAFLAYSSILSVGYWADANKPGCAPMRGLTFYEETEPDQPGNRARIHSFAHEGDKAALINDIKNAKSQADLVFISVHWGLHFKEAEIAAYQKEYAYAAIDAGADAILGHHPHILKAIEIYRGKPIFYSMGNFAFELHIPDAILDEARWRDFMKLNPTWFDDPKYRAYPYPANSRKSMIVKLLVSNAKIQRFSFYPVIINEQCQPRVVDANDKDFIEVLRYMDEITTNQGINTKYSIDRDEILVSV